MHRAAPFEGECARTAVTVVLLVLLGCAGEGTSVTADGGTPADVANTGTDAQAPNDSMEGRDADSTDAASADLRGLDGGADDADRDAEQDPADADVAGDDAAPPDLGADWDEDAPVDPDVALCPVEGMDALYSGYLPANPYGPFPEADACIASPHDVIIVLGCPNRDSGEPADCQIARADLAVDFMSAGYGNRFITTGGAVQNEYVEAETLRDLLVERGISAGDIVVEPRAEHTDENIYYSTRIMEDEGWISAIVVSDDPGHLMMTAVCDSNCCVELGRLTLFEFSVDGFGRKAGHYVRFPWAEEVTAAECGQIELPTKLMCLNLDSRRACRDNFQLTD